MNSTLARLLFFVLPLFLILPLLALQGCESPFKMQKVVPILDRLPFPTKDQVALVDGRPLTLTDFLAIRERLKTPSSEQAYWVGIATLALQSEARSRGHDISLQNTYDVARYAIGDIIALEAQSSLNTYFNGKQVPPPEEVKRQIDTITKNSVIVRNSQSLGMIH